MKKVMLFVCLASSSVQLFSITTTRTIEVSQTNVNIGNAKEFTKAVTALANQASQALKQ